MQKSSYKSLNSDTITDDSYNDAWRRVLERLGDYATIIVRALNMRPREALLLGCTRDHVLVRISTAEAHLVLRIAPEGDLASTVYFGRALVARRLPAAQIVHADLSATLAPFTYVLESYVCGSSAAVIAEPHLLRAAAQQAGRALRRVHRLPAAGWGAPTPTGRWPTPDWRAVLARLHAAGAPAPYDAMLFDQAQRATITALLDHPDLAVSRPQVMHGAFGPQAVRFTLGEHVQLEALVEPGTVVGGDGLLDLAAGLDPDYAPEWRAGLLEGYAGLTPLSADEVRRLDRLRLLTCYWNACQRYARAEPHALHYAEALRLLAALEAEQPGQWSAIMPNRPDVIVLPDPEAVQQAAAEWVAALAQARIAATGRFVVALAGGSTPRGLYRRLAQAPLRERIAWEHVWVLWGDERYVPADDPESSYAMARETLLDKVAIPPEQIVPIDTTAADPAEAAAAYARQVQTVLALNNGQFDLALLGMGPDGHTASLFPYHAALATSDDVLAVAVAGAPKPPPRRISLTATALNRAAQVLVLVTGEDKAATLQAALYGPHDPQRLPIQLVAPPNGRVTWMVDSAAARDLPAST